METEIDQQVEELRHRCDVALQRRLSDPKNLSPATLIRILSPVIEKYLAAGLVLEEVAKALREEGFPITKGHLVRHLGAIRAESGLPPLRRGKRPAQGTSEAGGAPAAREGREQEKAPAGPVPAQSPAAVPVPVPQAATPAQKPAPARHLPPPTLDQAEEEESRPVWVSDKEWEMKPKIHRILNEFPEAAREYPELAKLRFWVDKRGRKWDVHAAEKPENDADRLEVGRANRKYQLARDDLFISWGLASRLSDDHLTERWKVNPEFLQPLSVDPDKLVAEHLN